MLFKRKSEFDEQDLNSVLEACKLRNPQAQRCLIRHFAGYAKSVAGRYSANREEAEEIINDSFLKVFLNLKQYDVSLPFKSWFRRIIINTAISYHRKNLQWQLNIEELGDIDVADMSIDTVSAITSDEILELIQGLPPAYRVVFTLFVVDGYSHKEIAGMLDIQEGTSKSNLRDARKKLQTMIKACHPDLYQLYNCPSKRSNGN